MQDRKGRVPTRAEMGFLAFAENHLLNLLHKLGVALGPALHIFQKMTFGGPFSLGHVIDLFFQITRR